MTANAHVDVLIALLSDDEATHSMNGSRFRMDRFIGHLPPAARRSRRRR